MGVKDLSTYDITKDYQYNLEHGPKFEGEIPEWKPTLEFKLLDFPLNSPLGIPAGLLLDSKWVKLYASLGYDILTYKTVRTREYPSHPWPNCLFVKANMLDPESLPSALQTPKGWEPDDIKKVTITNSFGMPSKKPDEWQEDVRRAKTYLKEGQILIVSGTGTFEDSRSKLVDDFVRVASMIKEVEAEAIELNFSCPNTTEGEGMIYTDPDLASWITREVKRAASDKPLFIKIGYLRKEALKELLKAVAFWIEGVVGVNSLSVKVVNEKGLPVFGDEREKSGICGWAVRECGLALVREMVKLKRKEKFDFIIGGCGGVTEPKFVDKYLEEEADVVFTCTGAMFDPYLALRYKFYL